MHVDVSTINHKFDKRVPSFSFYFLASFQRKFQQGDRERRRDREEGGRERWSDARQLRATRCRTRKVFLGERRSREAGSAGERGGWRAKNSAKKSRAILWRGICTVHSGKSWEAISQLDGLVCHDEL